MKIRWLRMTGIGPFAGAHTVDFSAFDESGLFLLEGPTGAGKSTLIDAITFALYGDVARTKDASKDRLRSNHISDSDPSEADLVFEVATGIYRVAHPRVHAGGQEVAAQFEVDAHAGRGGYGRAGRMAYGRSNRVGSARRGLRDSGNRGPG